MLSLYPRNTLSCFDREFDIFEDFNPFYQRIINPYKRRNYYDYDAVQNCLLNLMSRQDDLYYDSEDEDETQEILQKSLIHDSTWNQLFKLPEIIKKRIHKQKRNNNPEDDDKQVYFYKNNSTLKSYTDKNGHRVVTQQSQINKNGKTEQIMQRQVFDKNNNLISQDRKQIGGKTEQQKQLKCEKDQDNLKEIKQDKQSDESKKKLAKKQKNLSKKLKQQKLKKKIKKLQKEKKEQKEQNLYSSTDSNNSNEVIIEDEITGEQQIYSSDSNK